TRSKRDWSSDVCSSDLACGPARQTAPPACGGNFPTPHGSARAAGPAGCGVRLCSSFCTSLRCGPAKQKTQAAVQAGLRSQCIQGPRAAPPQGPGGQKQGGSCPESI